MESGTKCPDMATDHESKANTCANKVFRRTPVIRGIHGMFYTSQPEEARAFVRDKLQLPFTDVGEGWLIFDVPEADVCFHPVKETGGTPSGTHEVSFYCDDLQATVASLRERGVVFEQEIRDAGFGLVTYFIIPGGVKVELYEPKYVKHKAKASSKARSPLSQGAKRGKPSKPGRVSRHK